MSDSFTDQLRRTYEGLTTFVESANDASVTEPLAALERAANDIGKAWSGSWLGHHARIYYNGFKSPPPGHRFSVEWGTTEIYFGEGTLGDWKEYDADAVREFIINKAGNPDLTAAKNAAAEGRRVFGSAEAQFLSILEVANSGRTDGFLTKLIDDTKRVRPITADEYIEHLRPKGQLVSRDSEAVLQGIRIPPHIGVLAEVEQVDGRMQARMNVIHEVGLFQGRLGFTKGIVLIEEGCEEFSNIQGLGQIRFPKGNIKAVFEEIRQVLEREGLLAASDREN